jgi:hypothetical protein
MAEAIHEMKDIMKTMILYCKVTGQMSFRVRIGIRLMNLAAIVMGLDITIRPKLQKECEKLAKRRAVN